MRRGVKQQCRGEVSGRYRAAALIALIVCFQGFGFEINSVRLLSPTKLVAGFSGEVDEESAGEAGNYLVSTNPSVTAPSVDEVTVGEDFLSCTLSIGELPKVTIYKLSATSITAQGNPSEEITPDSVAFTNLELFAGNDTTVSIVDTPITLTATLPNDDERLYTTIMLDASWSQASGPAEASVSMSPTGGYLQSLISFPEAGEYEMYCEANYGDCIPPGHLISIYDTVVVTVTESVGVIARAGTRDGPCAFGPSAHAPVVHLSAAGGVPRPEAEDAAALCDPRGRIMPITRTAAGGPDGRSTASALYIRIRRR